MKKKIITDVAIFFLVLFIYIFITVSTVDLDYEYREVSKRKNIVDKIQRELVLKYSNLTSPSRIEEYAVKNLGLTKPKEKQFRYISD